VCALPAAAASAPSAITGPLDSFTATSATVTGTVNPNGSTTSWTFEYGTTTGYGAQTLTENAGTGSANLAVSAALTGLTPGTTYHYRLVAMSTAGTTDGSDGIFTTAGATTTTTTTTTSGPGPTATTGSVSSVTPSSAKLNGSVNPNDQPTTWYFQYGPTLSYGSQSPTTSIPAGTSSVSVSFSLSGLAAATIYHYRLVATNASGTSDGADRTFGSTPPPVVQTGTAEGAEATSVTLTAAVDAEGLSTNWYFQYGTSTAYGTTTSTVSAGSGTSARTVTATISKLEPATSYHYRIVASSAAGTSYGSDVTFTTPEAVTLVAESTQAVYGLPLTLSGTVAGSASGVTVTVLAEPNGLASFAAVATVVSRAGGIWSYQAKPALETNYEASTTVGASPPVTIDVRPAIAIHLISGARFLIHVAAAKSFAGRTIQVQRLGSTGAWSTISRMALNANSSVILPVAALPLGSSTLRIAMSINQAGHGYLAGFSRALSFTRSAPPPLKRRSSG
jgi:hypothetical protein